MSAFTDVTSFETRPEFRGWAGETQNYQRYAIVRDGFGSGLRWVRLWVDNDRIREIDRSPGCFYDADDHPEGAIEWCVAATKAHRAKTLKLLGSVFSFDHTAPLV